MQQGCVQLQAGDIEYLGFGREKISETMYLLFEEAGLLQSREQLWEIKKKEILALPDPLDSILDKRRRLEVEGAFHFMSHELVTVFKKYIRPGQIVFKKMPDGNEHAVLGFTTHFVIDINIVCDPEQVHKRLAALWGSDFECQTRCQCQRRLLNDSMIEAISRQTGAPERQRIMAIVMAEYMLFSDQNIDLVNATSFANGPNVSRPNSATGPAAPVRPSGTANFMSSADDGGSFSSRPAGSLDDSAGFNKADPQPSVTFVKGNR